MIFNLEALVQSIHLSDLASPVLFAPLVVLDHLSDQEFFRLVKALRNELQTAVYLHLLVLEALDVLPNLVDSYLKAVVLGVLVIHCQQALIVLLEVVLPFFVEQLVLTDF